MEITELKELDAVDRSVGTPSAQKVIQFLVCWEKLTVKELIRLTGLSESQIHVTLQNLVDIDIVVKESRGVYCISSNSFTKSLKKAYRSLIERVVGKFIYNITHQLDEMSPDEISEKLGYMIEKWKPIIDLNYKSKLSSLAEYIIDRY